MRSTSLLNINVDLSLSNFTMLGHAHLIGESSSRSPSSRVTRSDLLQHLINLLKRQPLSLRDEEVSVDASASAQSTPDEENLGTEVALSLGLADHVGGDGGDDSVPEPVAGGRETDTAGTDGQREDLADQDPSARAPGGCEEGDSEADEGDLGLGGGLVLGRDGGAEDSSEELADEHAQGTPDEQGTTTEAFDGVERDGSGKDVDESGDETDEEGVGNRALSLLADEMIIRKRRNLRAAGRRWYRRRR
jgi:hypothetical protein